MGIQSISNVVIATVLFITQFYTVNTQTWTCSKNATAVQVIPSQVAGTWYEIARAPSSEVPACLKVIVPDSQVNNEFTLELDYVNNVNKGWKPTEESLKFPWDEAQNGTFNLLYSDGVASVDVHFKYMGTMNDYAVVCGYSGLASGISMVRLLSRDKTVNNTVIQLVDQLAENFNLDLSEITWVQQDEKCNGAENLSSFGLALMLAFYLLHKIL